MDPIKLELIKMAAAQTAGKSGKDLAPILFALITNAGKHNIQFSPEEITLILDLLKEGKSCRVVGYRHGEFMDFDINEALAMQKDVSPYMWEVCNSLSHNYRK